MEGRFIKKKLKGRRVVVIVICIFVLSFSIFQSTMVVKASEDKHISYRSIEIKVGDTLWKIAEENCPCNIDIEEYLEEIKETNDITMDYIVQGNYLLIPVYD